MAEDALEYLKESVVAFNRWREKNPGVRVILEGAELSGRDLSRANFAGADLSGVSFKGCTLEGAVFKNAILSGCDFTGAQALRANFDYAKATSAAFMKASAADGSFIKATLHHVDFTETDLRRAMFTGSDVTGCNFTGCTVTGANFDKTNLNEATFRKQDFESVVLPFDSVFSLAEKNRSKTTLNSIVSLVVIIALVVYGYVWIARASTPGALNSLIRSQWVLMHAKSADSNGDFIEAEKSYRLALKINPNGEDVCYSAALFYQNRRQPEKAYPLFKRFLALQPNSAEHADRAKTFVDTWESR